MPFRTWLSGWGGVLLVTATASAGTGLLLHAERTTASIHDRTSNIAVSSRGLDADADTVAALARTNDLAASIGAALLPLSGPTGKIDTRSARIVELLATIRKSTASIDGSTVTIDRSAGRIRAGLAGIDADTAAVAAGLGALNADAAGILAGLTRIARGVSLINDELPATAAILDAILAEGRDILATLGRTERLVGCIDRGLNGTARCPARGGRP